MIQTLEAIEPSTDETFRAMVAEEALIDRSSDATIPLAERAVYLGALCIMEETSRANEHYSKARAKADWREGMMALDRQERVASHLGQSVCVPTLRGPEFRPGLEKLMIEADGKWVGIRPSNVMDVLHEQALFLNGTPFEEADAGTEAKHGQVSELPDRATSHSVQPESASPPARNRASFLGRVASWFKAGKRRLSRK